MMVLFSFMKVVEESCGRYGVVNVFVNKKYIF